MKDFIKVFGVPILLFVAMGYATLSHACGGDDVVYPETVETPTFEFRI